MLLLILLLCVRQISGNGIEDEFHRLSEEKDASNNLHLLGIYQKTIHSYSYRDLNSGKQKQTNVVEDRDDTKSNVNDITTMSIYVASFFSFSFFRSGDLKSTLNDHTNSSSNYHSNTNTHNMCMIGGLSFYIGIIFIVGTILLLHYFYQQINTMGTNTMGENNASENTINESKNTAAIVCSKCNKPITDTHKLQINCSCNAAQYCGTICKERHWQEHKAEHIQITNAKDETTLTYYQKKYASANKQTAIDAKRNGDTPPTPPKTPKSPKSIGSVSKTLSFSDDIEHEENNVQYHLKQCSILLFIVIVIYCNYTYNK